jgi:hypothetical protein
MATVKQDIPIGSALQPSSNKALWKVVAGTNFPIRILRFDPATDWNAFFKFQAISYGTGNLTLRIQWYADTASSGNVVWQAQLAAITPDSDTQDVETKAFATLNFVQDTHLGTTGQRLHECTITISNLDSLAAGDWCVLKFGRDADGTNATDDMTGEAFLAGLQIEYSDT